MYHPKYSMFFDMHTMKGCPEVGKNFDAAVFAQKLKNAGVDFCGFHAKCNQGFSYYNTKIGNRHPSMAEGQDLFGDVVAQCNKAGIQVTAYFNCGLSNEDAIKHPEWSRVGLDGNILHPEIYDIGWITPYMRTMCPNSPWREHLLSMIKEVKDNYPVAGFLFDSFNVFPCICPRCVKGMKAANLDYTKEEDVMKFAQQSVLSLAEDISKLIEPRKNGLLAYFLGIGSKDNARIGSYLECECLPNNPAWGYDLLPLFARYFRNLSSNDEPVLNMTGRFNNWGDFGSLRTKEALEYDVLFGLVNGMRPNIGDHLHARGDLFDSVFDLVKSVYDKAKSYDPWFIDAKNLTELAVVIPKSMEKTPELVGITRMLSELKIQFDFIDKSCDWSKYSLLILPDTVLLDDEFTKLIKEHLASGKKIIATGKSGLDANGNNFVFEKEWGVKYISPCEYNTAYFKLLDKYAQELPVMPLATNLPGEKVELLPGSIANGFVISSWYNKHWDGEYSHFYTPPAKETNLPFLVLGEQVAYCAFPLAQAYYTQTTPDLRKVLEIMIRHFIPEFIFAADKKLPSFARAFVSEKDNLRIVNLLNYVPDLRGLNLMIEDALPLGGINVNVKVDLEVEKVYFAPTKEEIPFTVSNNRVYFTVPESYGFAMIVIESKK